MSNEEKKKLILDFINGPLREYLQDQISFGRFKERINETCGTDFRYSELYPSYLFNGVLTYPEEESILQEYNDKLDQCRAYGICSKGDDPYMFPCNICPGRKV